MADNTFDNQIKTVLENLEEPYDTSSWALLDRKLDALDTGADAEQRGAGFDTLMAGMLSDMEAPYQPAHWDMLSKRMDNNERFAKRIWVSKLAEAAIFLLLLVNINYYLNNFGNTTQPPVRFKPDQPVANVPGKYHRGAGMATTADNLPALWQAEGSGVLLEQEMPVDPLASLTSLGDGTENGPEMLFTTADASGNLSENAAIMTENRLTQAGFLALFVPGELVSKRHIQVAGVPVKPLRQHGAWYAASYAGLDVNRVQESGALRPAKSYSGVVAAGYRKGNWGFEAGVGYTSKNYEPSRNYQVVAGTASEGFWGSALAEVDADMLTVPLKVTRKVVQKGKNSVHAVAGTTANIALQKSNRYQTVFYPPSGQTGGTPQQPPIDPQYQPEGRGVFENGSLSGNAYATVDAGLRLEHRINRTTTVFAEPLYRHALGNKGIGQQPARMNAFSFNAGVMASL